MATIRSFERPFELTDYTQELISVPNTWGLINELAIFRSEPVAQHSITVESNAGTLALITDQVRGGRNTMNSDDTRTLRSFPIPHFPLDDAVTPQDVQGRRAYGSADAAETEAAVIARKLSRIRMNHAVTMEAARAFAITTGAIYAPNGTVAANYYTDFGVTRRNVDMTFATGTTDLNARFEEVIAHIQDNILTGEVVSDVVALCSPEFFTRLIGHARVQEAYKFYSSTQEPLRNRLGSGLYRRFVYSGITFIEYRGSYNGARLIPVGEAYFMPTGTVDMFISYFSPANKFSHVNTLGEEAYAFTYRGTTDEHIAIQTEHNALHLVRRPQAVVRGFSSN